MKIKHLLLGAAIVALMASCGGKTTETTTESVAETVAEQVEETITEEVPAAEPVAQTAAPAAKKTTTVKETKPAVDPCEAVVKNYEKWSDQLVAANKAKEQKTGAALKEYAMLVKQASAMHSSIENCKNNPDYKTRIANAMIAAKKCY
ncbi:MAG: hypothetical protein IJ681_02140 [Bacteroidales bacterium]|nr:hypothetical protein [Bacteroidales bacterium]